ncbi:phosphotransferase family protein [Rhodococcus pyridinivorans]|uniref:phosphotransferase family protein n=1 Tax=Rhodococcus pyridinivorans TaxID=103816 RepID=UPI002283473C|nr:aminoglycoside phosphotransferase family protein [Rhodococcus pyridinivorans]WAL49286.1 aminoglycoside phosphotransferase family protein [Rhodococcus pyridinivorans]
MVVEPIGTGQMADTVRCRLQRTTPTALPPSCVVKLPISEGQTAATARHAAVYERELRFYQELRPELTGLRCPEFYGSFTIDGEPALVLEDVQGATQGDQISGSTGNQAALAIDQLAKLQGRWWGDAAFGAQEWLQRRAGAPIADRQRRYLAAWEKTKDSVIDELIPGAAEIIEEYGQHCDAWSQAYRGPFTLAHHDYRLDNMLYSEDDIWVLDWQTLGWGPPAWDLAYFMGSSVPAEERRRTERFLVERHAKQLREIGIDSWTDATAWECYRQMAYSTLLLTVPAAGELQCDPRAKKMFATMWNRTASMVQDLGSREFLPAV